MFKEQDHLITHANCMDGAGCAIVWQLFGGNPDNIHFSSPQHEKVDALAIANRKAHGGTLYLADISISEQTAEKLNGNNDIILIDHHKSAIPLDKYSWCYINKQNTKCGSKLFWEHCNDIFRHTAYHLSEPKWIRYSKQYTELFNLIDDRDRWIKAEEQAEWLYNLFVVLGQRRFISRFLTRPSVSLSSEEVFAVQLEEAKKQEYIEALRPTLTTIAGKPWGFVSCEYRYVADAGNALIDKHELEACVLITPDTISLRSYKGSSIDVSEFAKFFNGGGHQAAAGLSTKDLLDESLIEMVIDKIKYPKTNLRANHSQSNCG